VDGDGANDNDDVDSGSWERRETNSLFDADDANMADWIKLRVCWMKNGCVCVCCWRADAGDIWCLAVT
jgi:hypothetical protein